MNYKQQALSAINDLSFEDKQEVLLSLKKGHREHTDHNAQSCAFCMSDRKKTVICSACYTPVDSWRSGEYVRSECCRCHNKIAYCEICVAEVNPAMLCEECLSFSEMDQLLCPKCLTDMPGRIICECGQEYNNRFSKLGEKTKGIKPPK